MRAQLFPPLRSSLRRAPRGHGVCFPNGPDICRALASDLKLSRKPKSGRPLNVFWGEGGTIVNKRTRRCYPQRGALCCLLLSSSTNLFKCAERLDDTRNFYAGRNMRGNMHRRATHFASLLACCEVVASGGLDRTASHVMTSFSPHVC